MVAPLTSGQFGGRVGFTFGTHDAVPEQVCRQQRAGKQFETSSGVVVYGGNVT